MFPYISPISFINVHTYSAYVLIFPYIFHMFHYVSIHSPYISLDVHTYLLCFFIYSMHIPYIIYMFPYIFFIVLNISIHILYIPPYLYMKIPYISLCLNTYSICFIMFPYIFLICP